MSQISNSRVWNACLNFLLDPEITELEANGYNSFFIKKAGVRYKLDLQENNDKEYIENIEKDLIPLIKSNFKYDRNSYLFEGSLQYSVNNINIKARCNIALLKVSNTPQVTIAKPSNNIKTLEEIANNGSMSLDMLNFIKSAVNSNLTIVFSGVNGSGKTTMLEACTRLFPLKERIGVAEDIPELTLIQPNVSYLHAVPYQPGVDINQTASLSWVVQQFLRMRTDKIVVGEVRGKEFYDFLTASNSGMSGSMTTIHANTPSRSLDKMKNLALLGAPQHNIRSINEEISQTVDIVIQLSRYHKISAIEEITDTLVPGDNARITSSKLYMYNPNTDTFMKTANISDSLRSKMKDFVNVETLLNVPINIPNKSYNKNIMLNNKNSLSKGFNYNGKN